MPGKLKTDINSFLKKKPETKPVLEAEAPDVKSLKPISSPKPKKGRVGRPPKAPAVKRNQRITITMTDAERAILAEKAGRVPEATYLFDVLIAAGVFDPKKPS